MAALITHITLTEKVFDKFFSDKKRKDFYIGTIFPDIRYLGVIDRKRTHFKDVKINDLKNEDSFLAGLKLHSLVDKVRAKFMRLKDIYSLCPDSKYKTVALKVLEDELYYNRVSNWNEFIGFLDKILSEELSFGIQKKDIMRWHQMLQDYFLKKPDEESNRAFAAGLGFSKDAQEEVTNLINQMRSSEEIERIIKEFYNDFESYLIPFSLK